VNIVINLVIFAKKTVAALPSGNSRDGWKDTCVSGRKGQFEQSKLPIF